MFFFPFSVLLEEETGSCLIYLVIANGTCFTESNESSTSWLYTRSVWLRLTWEIRFIPREFPVLLSRCTKEFRSKECRLLSFKVFRIDNWQHFQRDTGFFRNIYMLKDLIFLHWYILSNVLFIMRDFLLVIFSYIYRNH